MLPRHIMNMLGNCLAVLAVLLTGCSGQEIEVDLSNGSNRSVTVPRVNSLLITLPNSYGVSFEITVQVVVDYSVLLLHLSLHYDCADLDNLDSRTCTFVCSSAF